MTGSSTKRAGAPRWSALQRWTLGVTSMAAFMAGMDALGVTTALPTIHVDLGAATSALSWTVAAYALGFAAVVLAGVALGDRFGRRGVFLTGLALFTVGSAGCALSPNVGLLIATRAIQGVGGGLAVPLSLVLISEVFPPQQRARAIGIWGAITGMAVAVAHSPEPSARDRWAGHERLAVAGLGGAHPGKEKETPQSAGLRGSWRC